jgi:thymidylate synthase (FAD)
MRYTSDPADTYWIPKEWRAQDSKNKQSSTGLVTDSSLAELSYKHSVDYAVRNYNIMRGLGVAREIARAVLPVGMVTRFFATANLRNWAHWYTLRSGEGAQEEIRHYATEIDKQLTALWPDAWGTLKETA